MLEADDRIEIQELYARYCHAFDEGRADEWAELFTADGSFQPTPSVEVSGAEALRALVAKRAAEGGGSRHFLTNVAIDETDAGARGVAYGLIFMVTAEPPLVLREMGGYEDDLVRTDAGWRFARRVFKSWLPPDLVNMPFAMGDAAASEPAR